MGGKRSKAGKGARSKARIGRLQKRHASIKKQPVEHQQTPEQVLPLPHQTPEQALPLPHQTPEQAIPLPHQTPEQAIPLPHQTPEQELPLPDHQTPEQALPLPHGWINAPIDNGKMYCRVSPGTENTSPFIQCSLVIRSDSTWCLYVHGHPVLTSTSIIADFPTHLDSAMAFTLLNRISALSPCPGNPDSKFLSLANAKQNGEFRSHDNQVVAYLDRNGSVMINGQCFNHTVRHAKCHLLTSEIRCDECRRYRKNLLAQHSRAVQASAQQVSRKVNYRFMKGPDRIAALRKARQVIRNRDRKLARMKLRLDARLSQKGIELEADTEAEMFNIIQKHHPNIETLPMSDFRRVFWNQQVAALKVKGKKSVRWHPLFVRWCLNVSRISPKVYEVMRESGLKLPTRRTLNDYTHWIENKPGYQHDVDEFLMQQVEVEKLKDWQRYVVMILDEMKIHEDLVYDKHGHNLLGFVNLGSINDQLQELEKEILTAKPHENLATHMLTVMVRGIFMKLEFPFASFPTQDLTAQMLYWIVWEGVRRLEQCGLKVIVIVCDGAKCNRAFLKGMGIKNEKKDGVVYKTVNRFNTNRHIYFMSDVPHLIKTTRNCWYSSRAGGTRYMWNNGKHILWEHLRYLYEQTQADSGLYIGNCLKYEHINLTSFSKMRVNLAAQVLSNSVSCAFKFTKKEEFDETSRFCLMFDKFFDCLNTRRAGEGKEKRKPDLEPYWSENDKRFTWLEKTFLGYLKEWETSVKGRTGFKPSEKAKMMLSYETLAGLKMTVYSFVEMARYLLGLQPGLYILSERFNQDPLEAFFGQQRARGVRSDNPNVKRFLENSQAIRVQRSLAIGSSRNVKKRAASWNIEELSKPLRKRSRKSLPTDHES